MSFKEHLVVNGQQTARRIWVAEKDAQTIPFELLKDPHLANILRKIEREALQDVTMAYELLVVEAKRRKLDWAAIHVATVNGTEIWCDRSGIVVQTGEEITRTEWSKFTSLMKKQSASKKTNKSKKSSEAK